MELKIQIIFCILLMCGVFMIQAKIVYLNGTEVLADKIRNNNLTATSSPALKWYSIFEPRNISNHAGSSFMSITSSTNRKNDEEEIEESVTEEDSDEQQNGTMATRSARQLGLFYMQRILNGMHLLALLAGIYLMIFVVEPVAVPQHYLAQHYYGLPWSAQRRTNFQKGQMTHLPFIKSNIYQDFSKGQPQIDIHPARNIGSSNLTHKVQIHPSPVTNRLSSRSQNPRRKLYSSTHISQRKHIKKVIPLRHSLKPTVTSNITQPSKDSGKVLWRPLRLNSQNDTETIRSEKQKIFNSAGSATTVQLSKILH